MRNDNFFGKCNENREFFNENDIYNPYEDMFRKGFNTLGYRDNINLFDQILITAPLLDKGEKDFSSYKMYKAMVFNKRFLTNKRVLFGIRTHQYGLVRKKI